jgi:multiple sugar transport system ATP-binding protein
MATIELRKVEKKFGAVHAVQPMDLTVNDGEFVVLLGPSGCGKTTTLRMIAGLETVTGGAILLNGKDVTWQHPSQRDIAFVFQFFALYPHMSARQNIAFPLQAQGKSRAEIQARVNEVVRILDIEPLLRQRPHALSLGDQQRVALARALVRRPAAFLMDEPIGALDADLRERMRAEIKRLHLGQHATTVYVTHDQIEALAMGDRIVVMSNAVVQQVGTPGAVYDDPANLFVARFIGSPGMNLVNGRYVQGTVRLQNGDCYPIPPAWNAALRARVPEGDEIVMGFRPEAGEVTAAGPLGASVYATDLHGAYSMLHLTLDGSVEQVVHIRSERAVRYPLGAAVRFGLQPDRVRFFDPKTEAAFAREVGS